MVTIHFPFGYMGSLGILLNISFFLLHANKKVIALWNDMGEYFVEYCHQSTLKLVK